MAHAADDTGLTGRELAVLCLLAEGFTAEAIGRRLACSPRTVSKHLEHNYRKLGVCDRLTAVRLGEAQGLVSRFDPALSERSLTSWGAHEQGTE
jgi:DNA-binding CsgD family transcriptional regulator